MEDAFNFGFFAGLDLIAPFFLFRGRDFSADGRGGLDSKTCFQKQLTVREPWMVAAQAVGAVVPVLTSLAQELCAHKKLV